MQLAVERMQKSFYLGPNRNPQILPEAFALRDARIADAVANGDPESIFAMRLEQVEMQNSLKLSENAERRGPALVKRLQVLQQEIEDLSEAKPFSFDLIRPALREMHAISRMHMRYPAEYRDGKRFTAQQRYEEGIEIFELPFTTHDKDASGWAHGYVGYIQDRAKHIYVSRPETLPTPLREDCEAIWKEQAAYAMGGMGHMPWGLSYEFDAKTEAVLFELPSSHLLNWQIGDVDNLALIIKKSDLAASNFENASLQSSHSIG